MDGVQGLDVLVHGCPVWHVVRVCLRFVCVCVMCLLCALYTVSSGGAWWVLCFVCSGVGTKSPCLAHPNPCEHALVRGAFRSNARVLQTVDVE